jgi:hypothetical protein
MPIERYDSEFGYSFLDITRHYQSVYAVPEYYFRSFESIQKCLAKQKYVERSECVEHAGYLKKLREKLLTISAAERLSGITNLQLYDFIDNIARLERSLLAFAEKFPYHAL